MTYKYSKGNATVVLQVRDPADNGSMYEGQLVQKIRVVRSFIVFFACCENNNKLQLQLQISSRTVPCQFLGKLNLVL